MSTQQRVIVDRRLWGTWKSDRRRTFRNYRFRSNAKPATIRKFKNLFGHLIVRWTRTRIYSDLEGPLETVLYEVVVKDAFSVVVRFRSPVFGCDELAFICFEDDGYWLTTSMGIREFFRRIDPDATKD